MMKLGGDFIDTLAKLCQNCLMNNVELQVLEALKKRADHLGRVRGNFADLMPDLPPELQAGDVHEVFNRLARKGAFEGTPYVEGIGTFSATLRS